ncbi:esterase OVCA2-like [Macadamia integrifolia]|uniref:esterase OVCA2-like n=1 Tax=Macadamia integrifolia TaxID=60698 RepID=UPI001C4E79C5|nr:esterase OVCA2-like [Macadamia integrifolia]
MMIGLSRGVLVASATVDVRFKFSNKPTTIETRRSPNQREIDSSRLVVESKSLNRRRSSSFTGRRYRVLILEEMGSMGMQEQFEEQRKPRILCLHGFRTSGEIMKKQIHKWPKSVMEKMDLVFLDGPFPAEGKSDVEGIFDPPYYEWFQFDKDFVEYRNLNKCLAYIEECIIKNGPIDGLMGFSQGAILSAALPGLQGKGMALLKVPKIKFLIIIGGAKFKSASLAEKAYSSPIDCPSLHFLGETDFLKPYGIKLMESFVNPVTIHHPKGHTVPRLDEKSLELMLSFLKSIQNKLSTGEPSYKEEERAAF